LKAKVIMKKNRQNNRLLLLMFLLVLPALLVYSCARKKPVELKAGIILPATGMHAASGELQKKGYDLAIEEVNSLMPVDRKLSFVFEDDCSDEQKSVTAARKLIKSEKVSVIIGSYSSATSFNAIEIANFSKVPIIVPSAAADMITRKNLHYVFRINAPSCIYAETMLDYLRTLKKHQRLAVLYESSLFGTSTWESLEKKAKEKKLQIAFSSGYDPKELGFIPVLLRQLKNSKPDTVVMISYLSDAVEIMKIMKDLDINPGIYFGTGGGFSLYEFIKRTGTKSDYVFNVSQWSHDIPWPKSREFVRKYRERYNEDPTFHSVEAYVAVMVMAEAVRTLGDAGRIRDAGGGSNRGRPTDRR